MSGLKYGGVRVFVLLAFSFFAWHLFLPARVTWCRGVLGLWGAREASGLREGGVLEAQVFTYKWASKQYTVGSNIPY